MNKNKIAYLGSQIFDGHRRYHDCALLIEDGIIRAIKSKHDIPKNYQQIVVSPGLICPGFVDLQVNGGGGILLNDSPTVETMQTICKAHLSFGTTSLLPTLITDGLDKTLAAINAAQESTNNEVSGFLGLHLEGPHLSQQRKGIHESSFIRTMERSDLQTLISAAKSLPSLLVTIAPENVTTEQIAELSKAGAIVSLGHTNADYTQSFAAVENGASCVTHLFNAMNPLTSREPGLVGAALQLGALSAGLIADGFHVDPTTIDIALRAKRGPGKIFLVTDAMSTIGSDISGLQLNNRWITRADGRLTSEDGTLAGADLDMISAVQFMINQVGVEVDEALRMASLYPAQVLKREHQIGQLVPGAQADFLHLDDKVSIIGVWQAGQKKQGA